MSSLSLQQDTPYSGFDSMNTLDQTNIRCLFQDGAKNASENLSQLFGTSLSLELTGVHTLPFTWLVEQMDGDKRFQTGIQSRISGDIRGELFLFLSRNAARNIAQTGLKQRGIGSLFLNPLEESVINEFANIMINALWLTFNERVAIRWWLTPPAVLHRPDNALNDMGQQTSWERMVLLIEFALADSAYDLTLFFLPAANDLDGFVSRLREVRLDSAR